MMTNRFVWFSMLVGLLWSFGNGIQAADPGYADGDRHGRARRATSRADQQSRHSRIAASPQQFCVHYGRGANDRERA